MACLLSLIVPCPCCLIIHMPREGSHTSNLFPSPSPGWCHPHMPLAALSHTTAVVFQESNEAHYKDQETGAELEVIEKMPLLEWLANSYKKFGCQLEFVTNKSQVRSHPSCPCICSLKPV